MRKLTARLQPAPNDTGQALLLDAHVTSRVRVRSWSSQGQRTSWNPTAHEAVEIAYIESGALSYRIGRQTYLVTSGTAIVVPAGVEHATSIEEGTKARSMWLGIDMVEEISATMDCCLGSDPHVLPKARRIETLTGLLTEEAASDGSGKILVVESLAETLTVDFLRPITDRTCTPTGPLDPRIRTAVEMIDESFAEPLTVDDIASAAALSRFHFSRLFREQVGMSPYQYLVKVRVERAAELLRRGRRSVTDAAFSVGFQDLSRFSRAFTQRFGCKPSEMMSSGTRGVVLVGL